MRRILNVAEKPSIAKQISGILSGANARFTVREGRSKYNKNFDFNYQYEGHECKFTMTSVLGHLTERDFTDAYRKWQRCAPLDLFTAPTQITVTEGNRQVVSNLEQETRGCSDLIIWTDCDREGENIGFEVANACKRVNANIRIHRAHFSSIIPREIHRAMETLTPLDKNMSDAVDARSELDLRIGAAFTRFQTLLLQPRFAELDQKIISYGPCQFPTLGFIVERYFLIENFVSEPFWHIDVTAKKTAFSWKRGRVFDEQIAKIIHEKCTDEPQATVTNVVSKEVSKWRPLPSTTVELQKSGSTKLKLSSDKTMKIAEDLYNRGLISYPRTETDSFDDGFSHLPLVQQQTPHPQWGPYAQRLLEQGIKQPRKGKNNDHAHPPIHTTKFIQPTELTVDERKVYEFVTRRYLACISDDARGHETVVTLEIAEELFTASGLIVLERNYLDVYPYDVWSTKEMPEFQQGEKIRPSNIKLVESKTNAPNMLSEAELISLMDKNGIGTDATIHEHIKKVIDREYVVKERNLFYPSSLGIALVVGYDSMGYQLSKPNLRALMEADMKCICLGTKTKEAVIANSVQQYRDVFEAANQHSQRLIASVHKYFHPGEPQLPAGGNDDGDGDGGEGGGGGGGGDRPDGGDGDGGGGGGDSRRGGGNGASPSAAAAAVGSTKPRHISENMDDDIDLTEFDLPDAFEGMEEVPKTNLPQTVAPSKPSSTAQTTVYDLPPLSPPVDTAVALARLATQRLCRCGIPAVERVSKKEGANLGKPFFCCSKPQNEQCGYFEWNNGGEPEPPQRPCKCGVPSISRTVAKEGPNKGRKFLVCNREASCGFFEWEDEPPQPTVQYSNRSASASASVSKVLCKCDQPSVERTVLKEGANKGRKFFACSKPKDQGCGFFMWADDASNPLPPGYSYGSSSSSSSPNLCFNCNKPGHYANACPTSSGFGPGRYNTNTNSYGRNGNSFNSYSNSSGARAGKKRGGSGGSRGGRGRGASSKGKYNNDWD